MSNFCSSWGQANKELSAVPHWPATNSPLQSHPQEVSIVSLPPVPASSLLPLGPRALTYGITFSNLCLATPVISAFMRKLLSPHAPCPPNNNFSTLRVEFVRKYYKLHYLCKLHPQFLMGLLNDALPFPVPLKSLPITPWRKSHFQNRFKKCIYYSFDFILSFWKYLAALVCNVFLMLQITFFLTTQHETHEKSLHLTSRNCALFISHEKGKSLTLIKGNCTDRDGE